MVHFTGDFAFRVYSPGVAVWREIMELLAKTTPLPLSQ